MKILIGVDNHFQGYGGPFTAISEKLDYLEKSNIKFKLIYESNSKFLFRYNLEEILEDIDIVHIYGLWRPFIFRLFHKAKKLKKKIITSPIGALEPWSLNQKKLKKKIAWHLYQKKMLDNSDYIHATCEEEKNNIRQIGLKNKIIVLPHGISTKQEKINKNKNTKKKMIFFSRIHAKKGLLELIEAWKEVKNKKDWILEIYGPVSDENYFNKAFKAIKINNLSNEIKILNPIYKTEEKNKIFENSDCFILPSKSENFGISIGEALSFGLPVLTTTATPWKLINDYNAGFVFDLSKKNLLFYLEKFFSLNDETLKTMSLNAKNLINEKFEKNKVYQDYINFYKSIAR